MMTSAKSPTSHANGESKFGGPHLTQPHGSKWMDHRTPGTILRDTDSEPQDLRLLDTDDDFNTVNLRSKNFATPVLAPPGTFKQGSPSYHLEEAPNPVVVHLTMSTVSQMNSRNAGRFRRGDQTRRFAT
ncbi:hypothetical protein ONZ45_g6880 [Pleurotus djamor]|nr:hypothetical protein ONZ45_g6880 [Pleurotus djamor]